MSGMEEETKNEKVKTFFCKKAVTFLSLEIPKCCPPAKLTLYPGHKVPHLSEKGERSDRFSL